MDKPLVEIIIPSKTEKFLEKTTRDVLQKATGNIHITVVLDGYHLPPEEVVDSPKVSYLYMEPSQHTQKRHGINRAVQESKGDYVMSVDAHIMFAPGFDEQLVKDHNPNWIQVPRRNRLDAENWCLQDQSDGRPPIDYEYIMFPPLVTDNNDGFRAIHGFKWDARTLARKDIMIDDTMCMQASCWFMTKEWYQRRGFMQTEGYTGWGQESEELCMETWKNGGFVKTNKFTHYSHLHKGERYGRMYWMSRNENRESYRYSYNKWVIENKDFFISFINRFMPIPGWPENWVDILYKK